MKFMWGMRKKGDTERKIEEREKGKRGRGWLGTHGERGHGPEREKEREAEAKPSFYSKPGSYLAVVW